MTDESKLEVWYDGRCGLCLAAKAWAQGRDRDGRLEFRDLNDPPWGEALPVSREDLLRAMWVRRPDGGLASGFSGWLDVLRVLPGWRWLAGVLSVPPLSWAGPAAYRFVANHRRKLPLAAFAGACGDGHETCSVIPRPKGDSNATDGPASRRPRWPKTRAPRGHSPPE